MMDYPWYAIVLTCLVFLALLVAVVLCIRWGICSYGGYTPRDKQSKSKQSASQSIQYALTQLEGVTEKRLRRNPETEAADCECPICLTHLYPSEAEITSVSNNNNNEKVPDLEAGVGVPKPTMPRDNRRSMPPVDDEILKMKRCRHIFHARCLATWFLRKQYRCPVCRTPYYQPVEEMEPDVDYRLQPPPPVVPFW
ncbi:hypothetical protein F5B20DRAFT_200452 [Whalleya microplaca]|nr:hypothetical protein F5B20DRAFT_200452 [Whalleya microplaca]